MSRSVRHDGKGSFEIRFPYAPELVELIKQLPRRRWNAAGRFWLVPDEQLPTLVELLQPLGFSFDEVAVRGYGMLGGEFALDAPTGESRPALPDGEFTVSSLNERVRMLLEASFPLPVWLVGEISGFNRNAHKRHVGFQLDEKDSGGKTISSIQTTLFDRTRAEIEAKLRAAGDPFRLEDEVTVRLRVSVGLYVPWGSYRVVIEDLDPGYTLGEAARRREEILRKLSGDGLLGANAALPLPALPLRVGLITSLNSDAYNDVLRTLEESGFAFELTAHGARVQGPATEASTLNALDRLRAQADSLDVVLICRGGGARTDLAWFDSEKLGRAVAAYPLPIVVGIGHENDRCVLDDVARRAKTPTAAAALLVERVAASLERIEHIGEYLLERSRRRLEIEFQRARERAQRLRSATRNRLALASERMTRRMREIPRAAEVCIAAHRVRLENCRQGLTAASGRELAGTHRDLESRLLRLLPAARRHLAREGELGESRARRLQSVDPRRVLGRGYAILRSATGAVLTDASQAEIGGTVRAELRRGGLKLIVKGHDRDGGDADGKEHEEKRTELW